MKKLLYSVPIKIIIGITFCLIVSLIVNLFLKQLFGSIGLEEDLAKIIRVIFNFSATIFAYWIFSKFFEKRKVSELDTKYLLKEGSLGFFYGGFVISIVILLLLLLGYYQPDFINKSIFLQIYSFAIITTMAGVEEILLRGILYRIVEEKWGINIALIVSGLVFSLWHLTNENVTWVSILAIFIYSTLPCIMFSLKKRLWYPIFLHAGWNYAQAFYGTTLSGMEKYSSLGFIQSKMQGPEIRFWAREFYHYHILSPNFICMSVLSCFKK